MQNDIKKIFFYLVLTVLACAITELIKCFFLSSSQEMVSSKLECWLLKRYLIYFLIIYKCFCSCSKLRKKEKWTNSFSKEHCIFSSDKISHSRYVKCGRHLKS